MFCSATVPPCSAGCSGMSRRPFLAMFPYQELVQHYLAVFLSIGAQEKTFAINILLVLFCCSMRSIEQIQNFRATLGLRANTRSDPAM